ncbi:MAG: YbhB/YbcL family Raf kinase inhibitor-like protein [Phycisphaerales bacterium]|nr:YbhB/YbcL family Raf kinase inhibitor-like protein [Phycisphaerales bacterium]
MLPVTRKIFLSISIIYLSNLISVASEFRLKSKDITQRIAIANVYTKCQGDNLSPNLYWTSTPKNTKSFAIVMYDETAHFTHWIACNIPFDLDSLPVGAGNHNIELLPDHNLLNLKNDFGDYGYDGPCPPIGTGIHEYVFTLYALPIQTIDINDNIKPALVIKKIAELSIAHTSLISYYGR